MASLPAPPLNFHPQINMIDRLSRHVAFAREVSPVANVCRRGAGRYVSSTVAKATTSVQENTVAKELDSEAETSKIDYGVVGMHHVGILCENLERSLNFYQNLLGLEINEARPADKLPYRGAWLWVGSEMIHLMELPNPDPLTGRPAHGGRDRHACIAIRDVSKLKIILDEAGIPYTLSRSGRPAIFTRDPDANALEFTQIDS
ncbi:Glyoxylase I 4-like protein [Drosera capensis]